MTERLLKLPAVCDRTGDSKSTIYREIDAGRFPTPIRIGGRARWLQSEVEAYIHRVISDARNGAA